MFQFEESSFKRKSSVNNAGRTEKIGANKWETMIDVDVDPTLPWTIFFDTKSVVGDPLHLMAPLGHVIARVEWGSGNGTVRYIVDVTDLVALPVAGNHVKVALTLVSTTTVVPPPAGLPFTGSDVGLPEPRAAQAPQEAAALVSCFLSAGYAQGSFPSAVDQHVTPLFGGGGPAFTGVGVQALVSNVPVRMNGFTAFNPSKTTPFYLFFLSNPDLASDQANPELWKKVVVLPPNENVVVAYPASVPFDRGLCWFLSTTADKITAPAEGVVARVDVELVRRPTVDVVTVIAQTG